LRENGIILSVEEEATLLDCLDTERQAEEASREGQSLCESAAAASFSIPLIYYKVDDARRRAVVICHLSYHT
jgi:hypothetical protein